MFVIYKKDINLFWKPQMTNRKALCMANSIFENDYFCLLPIDKLQCAKFGVVHISGEMINAKTTWRRTYTYTECESSQLESTVIKWHDQGQWFSALVRCGYFTDPFNRLVNDNKTETVNNGWRKHYINQTCQMQKFFT